MLSIFLMLLGAAVLAWTIAWHFQQRAALAPRPGAKAARRRYPSVTVIRPIRGLDAGAAANFAAALDTGYPGEVETLFVLDDESDPALPVAMEAVLRHRRSGRPGRAELLLAGAPPPGRTGKLNAMIVGERRARGELIAYGDSDTRPDRKVLRGVVDALLDAPGAGAAFAPILVDQAPRAAGDVLYALMQNALYAPLAAFAAGERRELPFIMGQLMVFRREALAAVGGVACATGQLVDDMHIGKRLHAAGYKNIMSREPLHIATGGMTLRQFFPVYRRWMSFSRNGLPFSFTWRQWLTGIEFWLAAIAILVALTAGHAAAAVPSSLALTALAASLLILQRSYGGAAIPLRFAWCPWAFYLLSPAVMLANTLHRRVAWRGRAYRVDAAAALAVSPATEPELALGDVAPPPALIASAANRPDWSLLPDSSH